MNDSLSQTSVFGVAADLRDDFDARAAFEAAWNQHRVTCPTADLASFRVAFLAGLYHSGNQFAKVRS